MKPDENGGRVGEPQEHDSMLDGSEIAKRRPNCVRRAADSLGLSVRWMLVLAALAVLSLVLLAVVILLAVSWPPSPVEDTTVRCETSDCLRAAAQLQSGVTGGDHTACNSLWEHTCSAWLERNPIPETQSEWGVTEELLYSEERRLQRILSTLPQAEPTRSYLWKLNAFYQGCMERARHPDRSELNTKLLGIINTLGGFDILGSFEESLWNRADVIRQLQTEHNIDVLFRISVVADPGNSSTNVIQISPGEVGLPERSFYFREGTDPVVEAYRQYIQDVLLQLGATSNLVDGFAVDVFGYERRLMGASLDPLQLRDPARTPSRVTVEWLSKQASQIDWLNNLQSVYPGGQITRDTEVLLPDEHYILRLSKIVSSTDPRLMNEYLMWRLLAAYFPFLPEKDRAVLDALQTKLIGVREAPPHWLVCTRLTRQLFPLATGALLAREAAAGQRNRSCQAATALFTALKQTLGGALTYSRFVGDASRAAVLRHVSSLDLRCGYPAVLLDDKLLDNVYSEMDVRRHSFFDSVRFARKHQRTMQQKAYLAPGQDQELSPLLNGGSVAYSRARHAVIVPDQLLRPPSFDPAYPPSFQYGGLGTRLAAAILSSIEPSRLTSDRRNSTEDTLLHNQGTFRGCVSAALGSAGLRKGSVSRVVNASADQALALRLALQTLEAHLEEFGDEQLPGLEDMPSERIFFVAYGQSLCKHKTEKKRHWDEFSKFELEGKIKLDLTVEQAAPFREAFHCNETHAHVLEGPCGFFV